MKLGRWLLPLLILAGAVAFFGLGLDDYLSFDAVKARQAEIMAFKDQHPLATVALFLAGYAAMGLLPIPGAAMLTLLAGAVFGRWGGWLVASFTAAAGATLGFCVARYLLRDAVVARFAEPAQRIDEGIARDGVLVLFTVRLLPVLPFFLVNLLFGVSAMRLRTFYLASQIGMAPGALVFANAGRELAKLESPHGILSPQLLGSFALLALFPWMAKALNKALRRNRSTS